MELSQVAKCMCALFQKRTKQKIDSTSIDRDREQLCTTVQNRESYHLKSITVEQAPDYTVTQIFGEPNATDGFTGGLGAEESMPAPLTSVRRLIVSRFGFATLGGVAIAVNEREMVAILADGRDRFAGAGLMS